MYKHFFTLIFALGLFFGCGSSHINKQEKSDIIKAIDGNAIEIKDTDSNVKLVNTNRFDDIFKNVKVFGFGEATHGTKEFASLKVKFFKHLVENQGVKNFAIEVSYGNTVAIDEYIKGKKGNAKELTNQTKMWVSNIKEIMELTEWMRAYNIDKPKAEQLSFYGIDIQDTSESVKLLSSFVENHSFENKDEYLKILNHYISRQKSNEYKTEELKEDLNKMIGLKTEIENSGASHYEKYARLQHSIIQFINFSLNQNQITGDRFNQEVRDSTMAENVKYILEKSGENNKVFVWAHNGHITKDKITNTNIPSMGHILKEWYGNQYYSLGFDFATGAFNAFNLKDKKIKEATVINPIKNSRSELFSKSSLDNFLLDFKSVNDIEAVNNYLNKETTYRPIGSVYNSKIVRSQKLSNAYDGIIFIKNTTPTEILKNN